ncbi:MAG: hypothetical protein GXX96_12550 [Planctomycetaceae bacterium]|jgi:hypothetical protein|nr:hypothetical protein [Planctomycetaceae bacterium]
MNARVSFRTRLTNWDRPQAGPLNRIHLENLVAVVVDDLDGDPAGFGFGEGAAGSAVELAPGVFVDVGAQGSFEFLIRFVGTSEVGVSDKETLAVVVGVDEPARDISRARISTMS